MATYCFARGSAVPTFREAIRMGAEVVKVATSGGVLSTRDDPRHAHFRPAELDVLEADDRQQDAGHNQDGQLHFFQAQRFLGRIRSIACRESRRTKNA